MSEETKCPDCELEEWTCQDLMGGGGAAINDNVDGLCTHPECHPRNGPLPCPGCLPSDIGQISGKAFHGPGKG